MIHPKNRKNHKLSMDTQELLLNASLYFILTEAIRELIITKLLCRIKQTLPFLMTVQKQPIHNNNFFLKKMLGLLASSTSRTNSAVQRGTVCLAPRPVLCLRFLTDLMLLSMIPTKLVFESMGEPAEPPSCFRPALGNLCLGYLC